MILVFGGTTEGRLVARALEEAGKPFLYSTKGEGQEMELVHGKRLCGAMNEEAMADCCSVAFVMSGNILQGTLILYGVMTMQMPCRKWNWPVFPDCWRGRA